jgi:hypothetical protein
MIGFGKHRRPRDPQKQQDLARAAENIAQHVCTPRRSRSFDFRTPGKGSVYAFSLTWTPGSLALAGDCGEMILTHCQALWELKAGLKWAAGSDIDYLLGKSNLRQVIDKDGTVEWLIDTANEGAVRTVRGLRDDRRRWRAWKPDVYAWQNPGEWPDWYDDWVREQPKLELHESTRKSDYWPYERITTTVPEDGYEFWDKLRREFADHLPVEAVYGGSGRREIREEIERWIDEAGNDAIGEMTYHTLGLEAGPDEKWSFSAIQRIECVRLGARLALEALEAEDAEARAA